MKVAALCLTVACKGKKDSKNESASPSKGQATPADAASAEPDAAPDAATADLTATASLEAKSKSKVKGTVTFKQVVDGVEVTANIEGLTPGDHAFLVPEVAVVTRLGVDRRQGLHRSRSAAR